MLTKQLNTFQHKTSKGSEVIGIYENRCQLKQELIDLIDAALAGKDVAEWEIRVKELQIKRLDVLESLVDNKVALNLKREIQAEDNRALDRLKSEFDQLSGEVNEGKLKTAIEEIKAFLRNIKNKQADTSQITDLLHKASEQLKENEANEDAGKEINMNATVDIYKQVKALKESIDAQKKK